MTTTFRLKQGDTAPPIIETLYSGEDDEPIDLTGATVRFHLTHHGTVVVNAEATKDDDQGGIVRYEWQAGDTDNVGDFLREWEVTMPNGDIITVPNGKPGYTVSIIRQLA